MLLNFHPWIVRRTQLHEYFSRSWGMFTAAESAVESGTAAMLMGLSFELAFKALLVLVGREPPDRTHKISSCLEQVPELRGLMQGLWEADLNFVIQFVDEDVNSSQIRYGAAGSRQDRNTKLVAASFARTPKTWTASVRELYEELMGSIGGAIWENYPREDRRGQALYRHFKMRPAFRGGARTLDVYPRFSRDIYGMLLSAERDGVDTEYGAVVPLEGLRKNGTYWVRVRIARETAVDQRVVQTSNGIHLDRMKWIGEPVEGVRLKLFGVKAVLASVRPGAGR